MITRKLRLSRHTVYGPLLLLDIDPVATADRNSDVPLQSFIEGNSTRDTPALRAMWEAEVGEMRVRMAKMRTRLFDAIGSLDSSLDVGFLLTQRGMFSYTGLSSEAVTRMRERDGVYLIATGRVCIAGLNDRVIEPVAASMVTELQAARS